MRRAGAGHDTQPGCSGDAVGACGAFPETWEHLETEFGVRWLRLSRFLMKLQDRGSGHLMLSAGRRVELLWGAGLEYPRTERTLAPYVHPQHQEVWPGGSRH